MDKAGVLLDALLAIKPVVPSNSVVAAAAATGDTNGLLVTTVPTFILLISCLFSTVCEGSIVFTTEDLLRVSFLKPPSTAPSVMGEWNAACAAVLPAIAAK